MNFLRKLNENLLRVLAASFLLDTFFVQMPPPAALAQVNQMTEGVKIFSEGDYAGAVKIFTGVVRATPGNADAYYYLATSLQRQGRLVEARKLFEYTAQHFPTTQAASYSRDALKSISLTTTTTTTTTTTIKGAAAAAQDEGAISGPDEDRVPMRRNTHGHQVVTAYINGKSIEMLFDTGASSTVLGMDAWMSLGNKRPTTPPVGKAMGVGGHADLWEVDAVVGLGKMSRKMKLHLTDSMPGNGLLGQTFFKDLQYNIAGGQDYIHLFKKGASQAARSVPLNTIDVPFTRIGNNMLITAFIDGRPIPMFFDTGASANLIDQGAFHAAGLTLPEEYFVGQVAGVGGSRQAFMYNCRSIKVGELERRNVEMTVSATGVSLLGQPFFKNQRFVIDNEKSLIRFFR